MNRPVAHLHQHPRPKSPHVTEAPRPVEGCWYCSPWHSVPREGEPEKCWECLQDERIGIERMQAK